MCACVTLCALEEPVGTPAIPILAMRKQGFLEIEELVQGYVAG